MRLRIFAVLSILVAVGGDVYAVVGRPLTPVSYAGVARRTTRRTVAATSYAAPVAVAAPMTVLPAGCAKVITAGSVTYTCGGGVRYAPYYSGATVVYRQL